MKRSNLTTFFAAIGLIVLLAITLSGCADNLTETPQALVQLSDWRFTSGVPNNALTVSYSDATFELSVDKGKFWVTDAQAYSATAELDNGKTIYWNAGNDTVETAYVDITAKIDNKIVGYAVVKISAVDNWYTATVLKSVVFAQSSAKNITQRQVDTLIESAKTK